MKRKTRPPLPQGAPEKPAQALPAQLRNPRLAADARWQRFQRYVWDTSRGRG